ncbi:hypothetical protein [Fictibacillus phosphorivorans]|uniref:hypothetical protein n=1 Tax=Fictibacillus phosphorivorans TaxID=1221500 RepID=UPI00203F8517|nr:hypothetical protein [Fictibacillus phosphorivorans]MCM3719098.1 hypothetical protein [Fictibacillus phosphorivorans]MCM3776720.1 hypothetical protein [Fictibacillus phosphorivorans]
MFRNQFEGQNPIQQALGINRNPFKKIYKSCLKSRNQHVQLMLIDGMVYSGFIEHVDQQNVYFAIPYVENKPNQSRNNQAQYNVAGYQLYRCMFPLQAVAGVTGVF